MILPELTVIIPTYNRRYCLERAVTSVLNQSLKPAEIIVVDDGSTDTTADFMQKSFPHITYFYQENRGVSAARNLGIRSANTPWIAFLDSDDAWDTKKIEFQFNLLETQKEYLLCHTDEIWIRNGKRVNPMQKHQKRGGWIFAHCLPLCAISPSSVIIHQRIFDEVGIFDETLPACEDYDLWLRITAKFPVLYLDEPLTIKYGGHEDQLSRKFWGMDRYRISTLQKIIQNETLSCENRYKAIEMLKEKIRIYLIGAVKRDKTDEVIYYQKIYEEYNAGKEQTLAKPLNLRETDAF